jgi:hypothetical protein
MECLIMPSFYQASTPESFGATENEIVAQNQPLADPKLSLINAFLSTIDYQHAPPTEMRCRQAT